ncbi:hypothetical protein GCM10010430_77230 [Kitasatospora cystarginea]|uniref:Uncharacterized protein n=1 Tax=Kitasatospora cystarginea TaxID=58350 RepID=A0ABN3F050_9ACTN
MRTSPLRGYVVPLPSPTAAAPALGANPPCREADLSTMRTADDTPGADDGTSGPFVVPLRAAATGRRSSAVRRRGGGCERDSYERCARDSAPAMADPPRRTPPPSDPPSGGRRPRLTGRAAGWAHDDNR